MSDSCFAKYTIRNVLDNFQSGIARNYIFELIGSAEGGQFGLVDKDNNKRLAYYAVKNLVNEIATSSDIPDYSSFGLKIKSNDPSIRILPIRKQTGEIGVFLWKPDVSCDVDTKLDINTSASAVQLDVLETGYALNYKRNLFAVDGAKQFFGSSTKTLNINVNSSPVYVSITSKTLLGTEQELTIEKEDVKIYPNPFLNSTTISSLKPIGKVEIFNSLGNIIKSINTSEQTYEFGDGLSPGVYFLKTNSNTLKLIKQ